LKNKNEEEEKKSLRNDVHINIYKQYRVMVFMPGALFSNFYGN